MCIRDSSKGEQFAIIIRAAYRKDGVEFFTPDSYPLQLGYMKYPPGQVIAPHMHNSVKRDISFAQEVLYIKSGRVRVDFYDGHQAVFQSTVLETGDVILLAFGGHGFGMLEESEIIEVKQGPYGGDDALTRFAPVTGGQSAQNEGI